MALTADLDSIDFLVGSRPLTPEDEAMILQAIEECRKRCNTAEYTERALRLLAEGRAIQERRAASREADLPRRADGGEVPSHVEPNG